MIRYSTIGYVRDRHRGLPGSRLLLAKERVHGSVREIVLGGLVCVSKGIWNIVRSRMNVGRGCSVVLASTSLPERNQRERAI